MEKAWHTLDKMKRNARPPYPPSPLPRQIRPRDSGDAPFYHPWFGGKGGVVEIVRLFYARLLVDFPCFCSFLNKCYCFGSLLQLLHVFRTLQPYVLSWLFMYVLLNYILLSWVGLLPSGHRQATSTRFLLTSIQIKMVWNMNNLVAVVKYKMINTQMTAWTAFQLSLPKTFWTKEKKGRE